MSAERFAIRIVDWLHGEDKLRAVRLAVFVVEQNGPYRSPTMNGELKTRSHSRVTPVSGSDASGAGARSASAAKSGAVSSSPRADQAPTRSRVRASLGHGVSSNALESPWMPAV